MHEGKSWKELNSHFEFVDGQLVDYDDSETSGYGVIVGCATTPQPVMGRIFIVEDKSGRFPNKVYPYSVFTCAECHLKPSDRDINDFI